MTTPPDVSLTEWIDRLDPFLREAAQGYLRDLLESPSADVLSDAENDMRASLKRQIELLPSADPPIPIPAVAMVTFFAAVVAVGSAPVPAIIAFALAGVLMTGLVAGAWSLSRHRTRKRSNESLTKVILESALPEALSRVAHTRAERAYGDAVRELHPRHSGSDEYFSAELRHEQIAQLNALLDSGRRLDVVRAEIAATLAVASPEALRAEADSLRERRERAADPGTRAAFAQSLALCEERLTRAESLVRLTGRIEAEQELVYQAFRAAQTGVASLRISPAAAGLDGVAGVTSAGEIAETIGRQTRAVEAAVQELGIRR